MNLAIVGKQETIHNPSRRSSNIPRPGPSSCIDPMYVDCTICGSDRIRVKGKRVRKKYRICQEDSAVKFLTAMKYKEDDVFVRCLDLYCHNKCFKQHITLPKDQDSTESPTNNPKQELFLKAVSYLDPMLWQGYVLLKAFIMTI